MVRRLWRAVWRLTLAVLSLILMYGLAAWLLGWLSTQASSQFVHDNEACQDVYVVSNGVHLNIFLPMQSPAMNWPAFLPASLKGTTAPMVQIGWGSRAFYTQVPTWGDLTVPLAAKALLWDDSVLFVRGGAAPLPGSGQVRKIRLNAAQYRQLNADIRHQFAAATPLPDNPHFYAARGAYQPLQTCNEWVRRRLQPLGVTVPLWSPFDRPLLWHLPRD